MRKQTKIVAVLSTAALLALGASMTSFAAGWEKDDAGIWHYYDEDDEMVTDEWKKDGGKWFYLDEDGDMLINDWVDDEYYVGEDGAMLTNAWVKTYADDEQDDPDEDGEHWYYFGSKGKKIVDDDKKINGKTYYFNEDGEMKTGWQEIDGESYYLGEEDDGARAESQWLWLEKSGLVDEDEDDDVDGMCTLNCSEDDACDDEGWYWFASSGKSYHGTGKKKINGKWYMFNEHGQMLYEWIDNDTNLKRGSHAQLDDTAKSPNAKASLAEIGSMLFYNEVEDGSRANGWYQLDGAVDVGTDSDTDWYYFDDGEAEYADSDKDFATYKDGGKAVYVTREKIEGKYFAFNDYGQMQDGLQYVAADNGFYYFDENGYQKTGKVSSVECDDDDYNFYFNTSNGKNGQGYKGEKDGYLYFNGKRLEAEDDYRFYYYNGDVYLTNTKGKIQKATSTNGKEYDIENAGIDAEDVTVKTKSNGQVEWIKLDGTNKQIPVATMIDNMLTDLTVTPEEGEAYIDSSLVTEDTYVSVPFISLYDDDIYTYFFDAETTDEGTTYTSSEGWLYVNAPVVEE